MDSPKLMSTADIPPQFLRSAFLVGHVPLKALSSDQRLSYQVYVPPENYNPNPASPSNSLPLLSLLVVIHGTGRETSQLFDDLVPFSHTQNCAILCPLFPGGLDGPNDMDSYKTLTSRSLRSDLALLSILEEVEHRWPGIDTRKFFMMGFSGGGQFAHRFLYLYPERLHAISVGAPGRVTQLDDTLPWPSGVQNVEDKFAKKIEKDKIKAVGRIQLVVGSDDNTVHGGEEFWAWVEEMKRNESAKKTPEGNGLERMRIGRLQTLQNLQKSWLSDGIESQLDVVPGVAHNSEGVLDAVLKFFQPLIKNPHLE